MLHTPLALSILIDCFVSSEPVRNQTAPAVIETLKYLKDNELIDRTDFPRVTDKGEFMLKHLLSVPFPIKKWEIPDDNRT